MRIRTLFRTVLEFILTHQYVQSGFFSDVYCVLAGSGQGLVSSAAVANGAFLQSCELTGWQLAKPYEQRRRGISGYVRYADNMLCALESADRALA